MGQQSHLLCDQFGRSVIALLLVVLGNVCFEQGSAAAVYSTVDLDALQAIFAAWNQTPDQSSNLYGWNTTQKFPCMNVNQADVTFPDWRGVQCLVLSYSDTDRVVVVVGLSISNASIVGTLPPSIANLTWLTTLELTGNPNLTGPLPVGLQNLWLNVLDVRDNGFNGTIPNWPKLWNLVQLDLSGNQFAGPYPFDQFSTMHYLQILSIGNNNLTGPIPSDAFKNKTELEKLDLSNNQFNGELPDLSTMPKLINLDVSGNHFAGPLPDLRISSALQTVSFGGNNFSWTGNLQDTFNLSAKLTTLDLSGNKLSDRLPAWNSTNLGTIQKLFLHNNSLSGGLDLVGMNAMHLLLTNSDNSNSIRKLRMLSLSNNRITHVIYDAFSIENVTTVIKLDGNPYCDHYDSGNDGQRCFCNQICFVNPVKANNRKVVIASVTTSVISVILIVAIIVGAILYKNRNYKKYLQVQFSRKFEEYDVKPTIFSYDELKGATRDFHDDMKLGQDGYGAVYKGIFPNGHVVAVKQLFFKTSQGLDKFSNEVVLITGMRHRNLVNLKGCCLREHQRLLVYEYVDNFDVDQVLLGTGSRRQVVSWAVRLKICLGIAHGLHYLHALAYPKIIHRDIKASNVLLDKNMEPKIADFGLALLFPDQQSHIMTKSQIYSNQGYLAPEYASRGQLSDKVDVYSFGVLCLEIISGRRNIDDSYDRDQVYLSEWAWILHEQDRLFDLVDAALHLTDDEARDVQRVINVCLLCIQNASDKRPSMARIVSVLQGDTESEVLVLSEGTTEPAYKPGTRRQRGSVDYRNNNIAGLDSVSEEGASSGKAYYQGHGRDRRGPPDDLNIGVELNQIRAI